MDAGWAAIIGAVVGAATGFSGTLLTGRQQASAARRARRANAYTQALRALQHERQAMGRTLPVMVFDQGADPPPPFTDEAAALAEALLAAHASAAVRRLLDGWSRLQARFWGLAWECADASRRAPEITRDAQMRGVSFSEAAGGRTALEIWKELDKVRRELLGDGQNSGVLGDIAAQVRKELGYDD